MAYGLSVYNIVDSANTTIGQYGIPVTYDSAYPLSNIATRQLAKIAKTAGNENSLNVALTNTATGFGVNPITLHPKYAFCKISQHICNYTHTINQ